MSYTPPVIVSPSQKHETTLIVFHGRGSTAQKFAEPLLSHTVSSDSHTTTPHSTTTVKPQKCFRDHFPNTKLIFPTAPLRRAVVFNRSLTHQWFDNWSPIQPELKQHLQVQGLRETSIYIHELLRQEIETIGAKNVAIMGLSQGCAASLVSTLLWQGEAFGGLVGMCAYLPFRKGMHDCIEDLSYGKTDPLVGPDDDGEDMFERDENDFTKSDSKFEMAIEWLREELQAEAEEWGGDQLCSVQSIPVFMGHGEEDEKVPCELGRSAADFLRSIDIKVDWKEYEGLGHWYSDEMLRDIIRFLGNLEGWKVNAD
ncbi:phospholipase/carboxylesterase family protein-like protein [Boeremia exigua]|uniref:phospholipase/carboxylesterase family protein-like protein n=1 Tax=Boeremia exigua TaxID=749465 RepID=UPI001E8EBD54|nr:phospholipase/carboxylesterase family protein-like protein [Boeremia exigua]KAH6629540.1 phospholipase/carboxylesterase family protein-like protein [Boeremia exigua]